jgi:hypothetical protein
MSNFNVGERLSILGKDATYQCVVFENGEAKHLVFVDGDSYPTVWASEQIDKFEPTVQEDDSVGYFLKGINWLSRTLKSNSYGEELTLDVRVGAECMDVEYPISEFLRDFVDKYSDITAEQAKEVLNG